MKAFHTILLLGILGSIAACKSDEGVFLPDCIAYAGDSIELREGRFEWDRFTDEVEVDSAGNVIDQFPDYPRAGTYVVDGQRVVLVGEDGNVLARRYLVPVGERIYLMTSDEHSSWQSSGETPNCALVLGGYREN